MTDHLAQFEAHKKTVEEAGGLRGYWLQYAVERLKGRKLRSLHEVVTATKEAHGWFRPVTVIILDDGSKIYPSVDPEGNAPGAWSSNPRDCMNLTIAEVTYEKHGADWPCDVVTLTLQDGTKLWPYADDTGLGGTLFGIPGSGLKDQEFWNMPELSC
jgi:hypothetical protein